MHDFATNVFAPLSAGFVLAGYSRGEHSKFLIKVSKGQVFDDAFEGSREPLFAWKRAGHDLFPEIASKETKVKYENCSPYPKVTDIDQGIKVFSSVSDAFIFFGYANGHREIKVYADDPLKADAIGFLNAIVTGCWGIQCEEEE